jgi:hypothetical protein
MTTTQHVTDAGQLVSSAWHTKDVTFNGSRIERRHIEVACTLLKETVRGAIGLATTRVIGHRPGNDATDCLASFDMPIWMGTPESNKFTLVVSLLVTNKINITIFDQRGKYDIQYHVTSVRLEEPSEDEKLSLIADYKDPDEIGFLHTIEEFVNLFRVREWNPEESRLHRGMAIALALSLSILRVCLRCKIPMVRTYMLDTDTNHCSKCRTITILSQLDNEEYYPECFICREHTIPNDIVRCTSCQKGWCSMCNYANKRRTALKGTCPFCRTEMAATHTRYD